MSIITQFDGKAIEELNPAEVASCLTEHAFFQFMESGRAGLADSAVDVLDTFKHLTAQRIRNRGATPAAMSEQEHGALLTLATQRMVSGFIESGSKGLRAAIVEVQQMVNNSLTPQMPTSSSN